MKSRNGEQRIQWVPKEVMIPVGADGTKEFEKSADSWTDSEVLLLRSRLPQRYHSVPPDWLRKEWINIRKGGTPGYKTKGHGPGKSVPQSPEWYERYLASEWWSKRKRWFLQFWDYSCCLCNSKRNPEVHHRTYARLGREADNDCVVLCQACHKRHHKRVAAPADQPVPSRERSLI